MFHIHSISGCFSRKKRVFSHFHKFRTLDPHPPIVLDFSYKKSIFFLMPSLIMTSVGGRVCSLWEKSSGTFKVEAGQCGQLMFMWWFIYRCILQIYNLQEYLCSFYHDNNHIDMRQVIQDRSDICFIFHNFLK